MEREEKISKAVLARCSTTNIWRVGEGMVGQGMYGMEKERGHVVICSLETKHLKGLTANHPEKTVASRQRVGNEDHEEVGANIPIATSSAC